VSDDRTAPSWERGRLDARSGPGQLLFGCMFEDVAIERAAFKSPGRVFCIASAGCTAMALAQSHDVVAVDVNPRQIEYVQRRLGGAPPERGRVDRIMASLRRLAPLVGWTPARVRRFLDLSDPAEQARFWAERFATRRMRLALDLLCSTVLLRRVYSRELLAALPRPFGPTLRARLERGFARHPNRANPYARALLLGIAPEVPLPPAGRLELACADAAGFLERCEAGSFDHFTLSNVLDGASPSYALRLLAAVRRAAAPNATLVTRSFSEPTDPRCGEGAAQDRALLWGSVDVCPVDRR
jgi:S-adenosylmethionine:diacylglycerol 3-amino-3-carboxypropyl transferase